MADGDQLRIKFMEAGRDTAVAVFKIVQSVVMDVMTSGAVPNTNLSKILTADKKKIKSALTNLTKATSRMIKNEFTSVKPIAPKQSSSVKQSTATLLNVEYYTQSK